MKRVITFAIIIFISFFFSVRDTYADEVGSELNTNLSKELKLNDVEIDNNDEIDMPTASNEDIFGDEQTFPFVAGLGKNAAH